MIRISIKDLPINSLSPLSRISMYSLWGNRLVEAKESFTVENCDLIAAEFGRLFAPLAVVGGASGATAAAASGGCRGGGSG